MNARTVLLAVVLATAAFAVAADINEDGNKLIVECGAAIHQLDGTSLPTGTDLSDVRHCFGLVKGAAVTLQYDNRIVTPLDSTVGQYVRVVYKYLNDHPEQLADSDVLLIRRALVKAFPPRKP